MQKWLLAIQNAVAYFLLDLIYKLMLSYDTDVEAQFSQALHVIVFRVLASEVQTQNVIGKDVTLVDG